MAATFELSRDRFGSLHVNPELFNDRPPFLGIGFHKR
jgi:hypothetical protein